MTEYP